MKFERGQIVKVKVPNGHLFGRVLTVDEHGDGTARFSTADRHVVISAIIPEMVIDAFYQDGIGRYGV